MDKSAREAGRTFEGMLLFMAAAVAAAVVFPAVFGPPSP